MSRTFTFLPPTTFHSENGQSSASMRRPSKTNLFKAFMRLNSISSRKDFLCFGSQMEGAAVTSTFSALRFSFAPGVYFHHFHFWAWSWSSARSCSCSCSDSRPAPAPVPIPGPDDSGRAMHIQLTFQLKSLCKAATKGGPTKRKASKVRTSSKPKLSAVQTPGSHNQ